jgi:linoleoyl-CoA desaturase
MSITPKFRNTSGSNFHSELKKRVQGYFTEHNIEMTGNSALYLKAGLLWALYIAGYVHLIFFTPPTAIAILECFVMGGLTAAIGFNVMHDACHGSFSTKGWVNDIFGLTHNFLGGNAFMWKLKHNIIHHTYTNVDGVDDDINNMPFMRQCSTQPWKPMHKYQSVYMFGLYGFTSLFMFLMDYTKYFSKKIHTTPLKKMETMDHVVFWTGKMFFIAFYIVVPILLIGWQAWLVGFVISQFTLGVTIAVVFQLAHVVEHAEFEAAGVDPVKIENEWAIHQVKTTANFAFSNRIVTWFVGGLNYQIEHHLFPRISHIHYPAISKIVKQTCEQFDLYYNYFPTTRAAIASHVRFMHTMGQRPQAYLGL